jgi:hypothetical protein
MLIPTSRDTTSIAALSGGSSRATIRSLNRCPYRATSVFLRPQSFRFYPGGNFPDTGGAIGGPASEKEPAGNEKVEHHADGGMAASRSTSGAEGVVDARADPWFHRSAPQRCNRTPSEAITENGAVSSLDFRNVLKSETIIRGSKKFSRYVEKLLPIRIQTCFRS